MSNDTRQILAEDGPDRKKLIIGKKEYKNHRFLELRYYFFDKVTQEFMPTKKGIALTRSNYLTVKKVIDKNHEQVLDWLGVGYVPEHVEKNFKAQEEAYRSVQFTSGSVEHNIEIKEKDPNFFEARHIGGKNVVTFNGSHPMSKKIDELIKSGEIGQKAVRLVAEMIATYSVAKSRLMDSPSSHPEILFEQLEYDWSEYLKEK